jgi:hypothetical protein
MVRPALARSAAVGRGPAGSHNAEHHRTQELDSAAGEEHHRRVENLTQLGGIARIGESDQRDAVLQHLLLLAHGVVKSAAAGDALRDAGRDPGGLQFRLGCPKDGLRRAKPFHQQARGSGAEAGYQSEREPVEGLFLGDDHIKHGLAERTLQHS